MKFSCEKALLQAAINTTSRAVAAKSSIPALEGILLQAGNALTISGYNMNTGIRTEIEKSLDFTGKMNKHPYVENISVYPRFSTACQAAKFIHRLCGKIFVKIVEIRDNPAAGTA